MSDTEQGNSRLTLEQILDEVEQSGASVSQAETQETTSEAQTNASEGGDESSSGGAGDALNTLLSGAGLMSRLPSLLEVMKIFNQPLDSQKTIKPPGDGGVALLCALKPYLNDNRRNAVETMIRISRLRESLRALR